MVVENQNSQGTKRLDHVIEVDESELDFHNAHQSRYGLYKITEITYKKIMEPNDHYLDGRYHDTEVESDTILVFIYFNYKNLNYDRYQAVVDFRGEHSVYQYKDGRKKKLRAEGHHFLPEDHFLVSQYSGRLTDYHSYITPGKSTKSGVAYIVFDPTQEIYIYQEIMVLISLLIAIDNSLIPSFIKKGNFNKVIKDYLNTI